MANTSKRSANSGSVQHLQPAGLSNNPAFTNVIVVTGPVKTIYIGGQDAVDASGQIVGKGDIKAQTEQVFKNLRAILEAAGSSLDNLVKTTVFLQNLDDFAGMNEVYAANVGDTPPARSTVEVAKLPSGALVEIEAIAAL